jgi:hypothetical protein
LVAAFEHTQRHPRKAAPTARILISYGKRPNRPRRGSAVDVQYKPDASADHGSRN